MKTFKRVLFALAITTFIFSGCKKFEDGPRFSLLTKKSRLTGKWKIEKVLFNGADSTASYINKLGSSFVLDIQKNGSYTVSGNFPDEGKWVFGEDKDDVYFTPNSTGIEDAERILRLKKDELWLRHIFSNASSQEIHYVPA